MGWLDELEELVAKLSAESDPWDIPTETGIAPGRLGRNPNQGHSEPGQVIVAAEERAAEARGSRKGSSKRAEAEQDKRKATELPPVKPDTMSTSGWNKLSDEDKRAIASRNVDTTRQSPKFLAEDEQYEQAMGDILDDYQLLNANELEGTYAWRHKLLAVNPGDLPRENKRLDSPRGRKYSRATKGRTPVEYLARVNAMEPQELAEYQKKLYSAGFYGEVEGRSSKEPMFGVVDEPTILATNLLLYTTMRFKNKSIVETLEMFAKASDPGGTGRPGGGSGGGGGERKAPIRLTNPLDLQVSAQEQGVNLLGRHMGDEEARSLTAGYQGTEMAAGLAARDGNGGSVTDPARGDAYAQQQIRAQMTTEVDSYSYLKNFNSLLERLGLG